MRSFVLTLALALASCGTPGPKIVEVPVPVHCATPVPAEPVYQVVTKDDGLFVRTQKLLANDKLRQGYIPVLKAWGSACNF